jgi:protoheme IX farnesyltransferase
MITQTATHKPLPTRIAQYWALTKPRVTQLAVFCAVIGMFLATDGFPGWHVLIWGTIGIWLLAGAAFAVNCLIEAEVDARMARTARRATAMGELSTTQTLIFSAIIGGAGMGVLYTLVNPLTMWLTFVTFVGYALIYTILLKPNTPQNIVIGGLSGAMPPALGWAAVANTVPMEAWLLVLIIFVWTPPHFWALAACTLFPFAVGMSGVVYLVAALVLNAVFLRHGWLVHKHYSDKVARKAFAWSVMYLALLFAALLVDHYVKQYLNF